MNRKQYFALSWFFLIIGFLFIGLLLLSQQYSMPFTAEKGISDYDLYVQVRNAIFDVIVYLSFPLSILFKKLGDLEPKKN